MEACNGSLGQMPAVSCERAAATTLLDTWGCWPRDIKPDNQALQTIKQDTCTLHQPQHRFPITLPLTIVHTLSYPVLAWAFPT
jgi:hypothetical protein